MKVLDAARPPTWSSCSIFMVVTTLATSVLVDDDRQRLLRGRSNEYRAEFVDATGVVKGDDVRIAGVKVGTVKDVEIVDRTRRWSPSRVEESDADQRGDPRHDPLPQPGRPALPRADRRDRRHRARWRTGDTIPVAQTTPALDLTVLFNGFKPLFQALSPTDINQLSYEIVQVFQGEGGTLEGLLAHTASVTSTLAEPRPGDRRPDRQPQRGARPRRRPRRRSSAG